MLKVGGRTHALASFLTPCFSGKYGPALLRKQPPSYQCSSRLCSTLSSSLVMEKARAIYYYSDCYEHPLPPKHRFPMEKYALVRMQLERHPQLNSAKFVPAPLAEFADLALAHDEDYIRRYVSGNMTGSEIRDSGFPWSKAGVTRALASTGGTIAATKTLLADSRLRVCGQVAGGTHHAFAGKASGFCIFNDIAVAARVALRDFGNLVSRILVIDLDTHQGDGTASIFENDSRVITFSMHGMNNFPLQKQQSDYDVGLRDGVDDLEYLRTLRMYVPGLLRKHEPQLVFYQAGVDGMAEDALGRMCLTRAGLSHRNAIVFDACLSHNIPCVVTMGGGYCRPDIGPTVDAHVDVYVDAVQAILRS